MQLPWWLSPTSRECFSSHSSAYEGRIVMISNIIAQVASLIEFGLTTSIPQPSEAITHILNIPVIRS